MAVSDGGASTPRGGGLRVAKWVAGVVGAAAVFIGFFILFAGEDQYLGFGGSTWRVGEIAHGWAYGLLGVGGLLVVTAVLLLWRGRRGAHP